MCKQNGASRKRRSRKLKTLQMLNTGKMKTLQILKAQIYFRLLTDFSVFLQISNLQCYFKVTTLDLHFFAAVFKLDQLNTIEYHFSIKRLPRCIVLLGPNPNECHSTLMSAIRICLMVELVRPVPIYIYRFRRIQV